MKILYYAISKYAVQGVYYKLKESITNPECIVIHEVDFERLQEIFYDDGFILIDASQEPADKRFERFLRHTNTFQDETVWKINSRLYLYEKYNNEIYYVYKKII